MSFTFGTQASSGASANNATSTAPASGGLFGNTGDSGSGPPKFSFGSLGGAPGGNNTASPGGTPGSIFGQQSGGSSTPKPAGALFGGPPATTNPSTTPATTSAGGGLFGGGASTTPSTAGGLFGGGSASTSTPGTSAPAPGGLFGGTSTAPASGGLFGNAASSGAKPAASLFGGTGSGSSATASPGGGLFGQNNSSQGQGTVPASSSAPLFGNKTDSTPGTQSETPTTAATTTPAKPMFSLGSTTPAGAPPADSSKPAGANLFASTGTQGAGTGTGLFGGKPATTGASAPTTTGAASGGGLFGAQPSTGDQSAAKAPSTGLFGNTGGSSQTTPSTQAPAASESAPTGGLFGAKPATMTPPATSSAATTSSGAAATAAPAGGLFGNKQPAATSASAAPTTTAASGLFGSGQAPGAQTSEASTSKPFTPLFGAPATSGTSQPASTSAAPAPSAATGATLSSTAGGLSGLKPATETGEKDTDKDAAKPTQNGTPANLGASTTGPTSQMARLKNKTMEDIVTRWASDLSKYQKEFKEQATAVSTWDRELVSNGEKIQRLYLDTFEAERASHEIERQLSTVENQQNELEAWLDRYESEVQDMFAKQIGPGEQLAGPDQEREKTYKLAEKLTQQLDEKSRDLSKMVKEINDISGTLSKGAKPEDPLSQIVRVLNGHLGQLQWIDANASSLQAKVAAAQKSSSNLGGHYGGAESDAAEGFYRSYMGRR